MKWLYVVSILILQTGLYAKSVNDHLNTAFFHKQPQTQAIDAAFVIRLEDRADIHHLQQEFEKQGIPVVEYNQFNILTMEQMSQFCSSIVSPYLLTQILSHLSIYKYCLDHKLSHALVLEDHAQMVGTSKDLEKLVNTMNDLQVSWDILYTDVDFHDPKTGTWTVPRIAEVPQNKKEINSTVSRVFCRYGTVSYVISKQGMEKILHYFQSHWDNLPFDQVLFKIPGLQIFGANFDVITNKYRTGGKEKEEQVVQSSEPVLEGHKIGEEFWIQPQELLSFDRMDILPKYIYANYEIHKYNTKWHIDMYRSHLEKWVKCYNTKPLKIGFKDFQDAFADLMLGMQKGGFDEKFAVGVNDKKIPWNGAHRIGTSLALGIPIKVKMMERRPSQDLTAKVFRETYHLEEKYLDHMASEYAKLKKNTYVVCLYPLAYEKRKEAEAILEKYGSIVHSKDIWLSESGALEFIRLVYTGEWWTGSYLDDFKHSRGKMLLTFPDEIRTKYPVRVYLFDCDNHQKTTKAKEEIRKLCQKGNEAIHINDTHTQTKIIAATLFNENGVDFLNKRSLKRCENFEGLFEKLSKFIQEKNINPDSICVIGDAVLSAYGCGDCAELQYISKEPGLEIDPRIRALSHVQDEDETLFNPEHHFYYNGVKFAKPAELKMASKSKTNGAA
jgi:GR25 family glycosyltransferase involved in LPS biosynthesis